MARRFPFIGTVNDSLEAVHRDLCGELDDQIDDELRGYVDDVTWSIDGDETSGALHFSATVKHGTGCRDIIYTDEEPRQFAARYRVEGDDLVIEFPDLFERDPDTY